jgi:RHS repeat-associated protein
MCEIDPATGSVCLEEEDFSLNGDIPFFFRRRYNNFSAYAGTLGVGWIHPYDIHLRVAVNQISLVDAEARQVALPGLENATRIEVPGEGIVAERNDVSIQLHYPDQKTLTFSGRSIGEGRLPLIAIDQTDENSVFLSYNHLGQLSELKTSSFHKLLFQYRSGLLEKIVATSSGESRVLATYRYAASGQLAEVYDAENRPLGYEYSGHLLTRIQNRMGGSTYIQYDDQGRATARWQDGFSRFRQIQYDDRKRTRLVTDSLGQRMLYRFNENNLLVATAMPDGTETERAYDDGNQPIFVDGIGPQTICIVEEGTDSISVVDPDTGISEVKFDERNRIVEDIEPGGDINRYEYNERNQLTREIDPVGATTSAVYDESGAVVERQLPLGNRIRFERPTENRLEVTDSLGALYVSDRDAFQNVARLETASGRSTFFEHDPFGRMTRMESRGATARRWYDFNGKITASTDLLGNKTEYRRDPFGLVLSWTTPAQRRFEYSYDSERRMVASHSSDGFECRFGYDVHGRVVRMRLRDGREDSVSYLDTGETLVESNSGGITTRYSFDSSGLITGIQAASGSIEYEYDDRGNLARTQCQGHSVSRVFGAASRLKTEAQDGFTIEYEHNAAGLVTSRKDSSGRLTEYTYDLRGQLLTIADSTQGTFEITRDGLGAKARQASPNGIHKLYEFDRHDLLTRTSTRTAAGRVLCERRYQYGPDSALVGSQTVGFESVQFRYDSEYQLLAVEGEGQPSESFRYDADHNILYDSRLGHHELEKGRLLRAGPVEYEYDELGRPTTRIINGAITKLEFGLRGLLRTATLPDGTTYRYEYDGLGRRVSKVGPTLSVRYYWDQDVLLREERDSPDGQEVIEYLFIPETFVPLGHTINGTRYYYDVDQRSMIREVYDVDGQLAASFSYSAYGLRTAARLTQLQADFPFRLIGQYYDPETGLHYNRFRYYDPETGRYLTPDPYLHQVEHNPYSFSPNPINFVDPYGLMPFPYADNVAFLEEQAANNGGWYECVNCGFRNKNRVFAFCSETGRPVGDGAFHGGHIIAEANNGGNDPRTNGQMEGGTCNCSKGKRDKSGLTCMDKYSDIHNSDRTTTQNKANRAKRKKEAKKRKKAREARAARKKTRRRR